MPMQGPQADSRIRPPAAMRSASAPFEAIMVYTCLEPGVTVKLMSGWTVFPLSIVATVIRSRNEELVQLPTQTWESFVPSTSETGTTLSGLDGRAIIGSSVSRLISSASSYVASGSGPMATQLLSRPWDFRERRVCSSLGKMEVVGP